MEIKEYFAHWFKTAAEVGKVPADKYESRINAILGLTKSIDMNHALDLVRIYFGLSPRDSEALAKFAKHFADQDASFDIHDSQFLFQILAAVSLIEILNAGSSSTADAVGLAILGRTLQGRKTFLKSESVSADLQSMAHTYITEEARRVRITEPLPKITVSEKKISELSLKDLKALADQAGGNPLTLTMAQTLFNGVSKTFGILDARSVEIIETSNRALKEVERGLQVSREETNIVWWLVGTWSNDLGKPFGELNDLQSALIVGKELADLTVLYPGPNSAKGFLHRALRVADQTAPTETASIKDTVRAVPNNWPLDWLERLKDSALLDFCPIHLALLKNQETPDGSWSRSFERDTSIKASASLPPVDIAFQFYRERLLFDVVA